MAKEKKDQKDVICSCCGDNLYDENIGDALIGLKISFCDDRTDKNKPLHKENQKMLDTFGKTDFDICFTCLLKSMGVKPKEKREKNA